MASTLLRLGLWTMILVLALYVLDETYPNEPIAEMISTTLMAQILALGALVTVAGVVLRILGKGAAVVVRNRCRVCRTPIPAGALYCREHLRTILHEEEDRTHSSRIRSK